MEKRDPLLAWICWGFFTLGLAQILPVPWLSLGFVAAGFAAEEVSLITEESAGYVLKFKTVEFWQALRQKLI